MSETKEVRINLKPKKLALLESFMQQHKLKDLSKAVEVLIDKAEREEKDKKKREREVRRWQKAFEAARKDREIHMDLWETDDDVRGLYS